VIGGPQPDGEGYLPSSAHTDAPLGGASLQHGLEILGLFSAERPWLRIGEIAQELGLSPFAAHAQVDAMQRMQFVRQGPGRRYGLGPGPADLAMDAIRATGLARRARGSLVGLHRMTGCTVILAMLDGTELAVADRGMGAGDPQVEMTIGIDRRLPAHASALGKVLVAYLPERYEQALVDTLALDAFTPWTIIDKRALLRHLQQVRTRGLAVEDREHMPHRRCLAAPVRGADRRVIAAVGLRVRELDVHLETLIERHAGPLLETAGRLSQALRYAQLDWPEL
jgi:DNA-binding IclR family transcriptional regulator